MSAENAADGGVAVFSKGADGGAGIDDLEGVQRRRQGDDNFGGGHGKRDRPGLEDGMAAGQQILWIDVGDGTGGRDLQIAADQLSAYRRTWDHTRSGGCKGTVVLTGGISVRGRAHSARIHLRKAGARHPVLPEPNGLGLESAHRQGRFHHSEIRLRRGPGTGQGSQCNIGRFLGRTLLARARLQVAGGKIPHLQHLLNGSDAGDRFLAEFADAESERAEQLVADINRTAAHSRHHACVLRLGAVEPDKNHVLAGTADAAQNAQNLDFHRFRPAA